MKTRKFIDKPPQLMAKTINNMQKRLNDTQQWIKNSVWCLLDRSRALSLSPSICLVVISLEWKTWHAIKLRLDTAEHTPRAIDLSIPVKIKIYHIDKNSTVLTFLSLSQRLGDNWIIGNIFLCTKKTNHH